MSKEQPKKDDAPTKETKEQVPALIEQHVGSPYRKRTLPSAKTASKAARHANRDLDAHTTREIVDLITLAMESGEFTIRVPYVPPALIKKLTDKGYTVSGSAAEQMTITWLTTD